MIEIFVSLVICPNNRTYTGLKLDLDNKSDKERDTGLTFCICKLVQCIPASLSRYLYAIIRTRSGKILVKWAAWPLTEDHIYNTEDLQITHSIKHYRIFAVAVFLSLVVIRQYNFRQYIRHVHHLLCHCIRYEKSAMRKDSR